MTLEETKKRIADCMKQSTDDYNRYEDNVFRGEADAYKHALEILDEVDAAPVGKDKLTLKELAYEWRKIIKFKYLAYGEIFAWGGCYPVLTTGVLPLKLRVRDVGGEGAPCYIHEWISDGVTNGFLPEDLAVSIDLSEYKDADGNIDYSKCIVEVE